MPNEQRPWEMSLRSSSPGELATGRGADLPGAMAEVNGCSTIETCIDNRNVSELQTFAQFRARTVGGREFGVSNDDDLRLDGIEERVRQGFAGGRETGNYDISPQILTSFEKGFLAGAAKV